MSATTQQTPFVAVSESYLLPANISPTETSIALIPAPTLSKLRNVGLPRIKDMRAAGVAIQIVSHMPVNANLQSCAKINDTLNAAICYSPDRFAAMALLPTADGREAAWELRRCVTKYKFVGGVLGLQGNMAIGTKILEELWGVAEQYRVPIVLKEIWPSLEQVCLNELLYKAFTKVLDSSIHEQLSRDPPWSARHQFPCYACVVASSHNAALCHGRLRPLS
jgi:predicted TIM-barrel fold metal-dependent hydrolase